MESQMKPVAIVFTKGGFSDGKVSQSILAPYVYYNAGPWPL